MKSNWKPHNYSLGKIMYKASKYINIEGKGCNIEVVYTLYCACLRACMLACVRARSLHKGSRVLKHIIADCKQVMYTESPT